MSFDSKFKDSPLRSRMSGNLIRSICAAVNGLGGGAKTEFAPGRGKPKVRHCSWAARNIIRSLSALCLELLKHEKFYVAYHVVHSIQLVKAFWGRQAVLPAFFGEGQVYGFEKIKFFRHATTFFCRVRWAWDSFWAVQILACAPKTFA